MFTIRLALPAVLAAFAAFAPVCAQAAAPDVDGFYGIWRNPKGSVQIDIRPCGENACGYVVWATPKAKEDARKAGTAELIGLRVFRDLTRDDNGAWKGRVFAPDLNMTFSGTAKVVEAGRLRAKGCAIAGILCKTQTWTRVVSASR